MGFNMVLIASLLTIPIKMRKFLYIFQKKFVIFLINKKYSFDIVCITKIFDSICFNTIILCRINSISDHKNKIFCIWIKKVKFGS